MSGFQYVATPYSKYPEGIEKAYADACEAVARLASEGEKLFCPIVHSHPLATRELPANDHAFWLEFDRPFLEAAAGLIVIMMPGWDESIGVLYEIGYMTVRRKPVVYRSWPDLVVWEP